MDVTIHPAPLHGTIPAIASKSMAHRLLITAALCPALRASGLALDAVWPLLA